MIVHRIRRATDFLDPAVYKLLHTAFASDRLVTDPKAAIHELVADIGREDVGLFIVGDEAGWYGTVLAQWNKSAFSHACVVIHFYNGASKKDARLALLQALVDYAREGGYDRIIGVDANDKPNSFARLFSAAGKPEFSGQLVVFDMREGLL